MDVEPHRPQFSFLYECLQEPMSDSEPEDMPETLDGANNMIAFQSGKKVCVDAPSAVRYALDKEAFLEPFVRFQILLHRTRHFFKAWKNQVLGCSRQALHMILTSLLHVFRLF